jgi:hypothetical protein
VRGGAYARVNGEFSGSQTMCGHLSIGVPAKAVGQLHRVLPPVAPAHPELDSPLTASIAKGGECFSLGVHCACGLFRKGATPSDRLRKRAKRDHWSQAKLQRALKPLRHDWTGLHPLVREAIATVADSGGACRSFSFGRDAAADPMCATSGKLIQRRFSV